MQFGLVRFLSTLMEHIMVCHLSLAKDHGGGHATTQATL